MAAVPGLDEVLRGAVEEPARPLPSLILPPAQWQALGPALAAGDADALLGLFVAAGRVNAMVRTEAGPCILAMALEGEFYPALSPSLPAAAWFERLARDLTGVAAAGAADDRAAIFHRGDAADWPDVAPPPSDGQYQIGEGPVSGAIAQALHRRLSLGGDAIVAIEHRLGYAHRGVTGLMQGRTPRAAAPLAARIAGATTVAHSLAFARAVEAALAVPVERSVAMLRAAMLAVEQALGALSSLGDVAALTGFERLATDCAAARRHVEQAAAAAFFHPLMMDAIGPGGLAAAAEPGIFEAVAAALARAAAVLRRGGSFRLRRACGRAAARVTDMARRGIASARAGGEVLQSVGRSDLPAAALPAGGSGTGIGAAETLSGAVHHWLMLREGRIAGVFVIDPGIAALRRLEAMAVGLTPEEARLCAAAMPVAPGGVDL